MSLLMAQPRTPGQNFDWSRQALMRANGLAGLGETQCDYSSEICWDSVTGIEQPWTSGATSGVTPEQLGFDPSLYVSTPPGIYTTTPGTSAAWANAVAAFVKSGMTLAQIQAAHPGMSISPNGAITYQNPGYPIGGTNIGVGTVAGISTTTLMFAGVAIVGLVLVMSMGRR